MVITFVKVDRLEMSE